MARSRRAPPFFTTNMSYQTTIDFTTFCHGLENSAENQAIYEQNLNRFNEQCRKVYKRLVAGERLSTIHQQEYQVGDLRARIRDLIKMGVPVKKRPVMTDDGKRTQFKEYFL